MLSHAHWKESRCNTLSKTLVSLLFTFTQINRFLSENNILTAEKAFVSLSLFNIIRFPMNMLPMMITFLVQITVSIKRIADFLKRDEIPEGRISQRLPAGVSVRIRKADFSWKKEGKPTLSGINIDVASGSLTAVVGSVGNVLWIDRALKTTLFSGATSHTY